MTFIDWLSFSKDCAKGFIHNIPFNPHNNSIKSGLYVRENKDLEEEVVLPTIWHLLVNGRAEIGIEVCLIPSAIQYSPLIILYYKY